MVKIILRAILAFLLSLPIGFLTLTWWIKQCGGGFACMLYELYLPVFLAGAGILLTFPIYFMLKKLPSFIQNHSRFVAMLIILIIIAFGLILAPK